MCYSGQPQATRTPSDSPAVNIDASANSLVTSHLVDIFAMVPQNLPPPASTAVFPAQDARFLRYQDVLARVSAPDASSKANQYHAESIPNPEDGWASDEEDMEESKIHSPVKSDGIGSLLGGFADAETAM